MRWSRRGRAIWWCEQLAQKGKKILLFSSKFRHPNSNSVFEKCRSGIQLSTWRCQRSSAAFSLFLVTFFINPSFSPLPPRVLAIPAGDYSFEWEQVSLGGNCEGLQPRSWQKSWGVKFKTAWFAEPGAAPWDCLLLIEPFLLPTWSLQDQPPCRGKASDGAFGSCVKNLSNKKSSN